MSRFFKDIYFILQRFLVVFLFCSICASTAFSQSSRKECRPKPKRFPSSFTHLSSDFANMNLQADVLPKRYLQLESDLGIGALPGNDANKNSFAYNSNLIRMGLGKRTELRTEFSIPGNNITYADQDNVNVHPSVGAGLKFNLLAESGTTPGVGIVVEYVYFNLNSHLQGSIVLDKLFFRVLKTSFSAGPQFSADGKSEFSYSMGVVMKDQFHKLGIFALASNKYHYLDDVFNMGLIFTDNLNYQVTMGYGVHEAQGMFLMSYTGIINYHNMARKIGAYF